MDEPEETVYAVPCPGGGFEPVTIKTDVFYRIVIPGPRDVWVVFEESNDQLFENYWFHLIEQQGAYDQTLPLSDASTIDEKLIGVCFPKVPPVGTYTLHMHYADESVLTLFHDLPWAEFWNRRGIYSDLLEALDGAPVFQDTEFGDIDLSNEAASIISTITTVTDEDEESENMRDLIDLDDLDASQIFSFSDSGDLETKA